MTRELALAALIGLAACDIGSIGKEPAMTPIGQTAEDAQPILTADRAALAVPPPQPARHAYQQGSLWNTGPSGLLGDKRARNVGDLLTVVIEIDDKAVMMKTPPTASAPAARTRASTRSSAPETSCRPGR